MVEEQLLVDGGVPDVGGVGGVLDEWAPVANVVRVVCKGLEHRGLAHTLVVVRALALLEVVHKGAAVRRRRIQIVLVVRVLLL